MTASKAFAVTQRKLGSILILLLKAAAKAARFRPRHDLCRHPSASWIHLDLAFSLKAAAKAARFRPKPTFVVIPAQAGIHFDLAFRGSEAGKATWIPACAGMTSFASDDEPGLE
ncbi:hypothetical protein ACFPN1_11940 [Lysobacter yangpyeongensis]|uniref:Uncharacterized protein n=1 Tax=Lysobacter yangpyeongensis TaxID=346182 RepID=A0ABW0SNY3_9GAMM